MAEKNYDFPDHIYEQAKENIMWNKIKGWGALIFAVLIMVALFFVTSN